MLEGMFACVSNVSFDPEAIAALERRVRAKAIALGEFDPRTTWASYWDAQEDIRSLKSLLLFGMRGVAAMPTMRRRWEVGPCRDGVPV